MNIKSILGIPLILLILFALLGCNTKPTGNAAAQRGLDAFRSRDFQTAVTELELGLQSEITKYDTDQVWTVLGNAYDELDKYEEAEKAHKKALELNPKSHQAWTNLGAVYRHAERYDEAEDAYTKALELKPDYPEVHASLGALYVFQGKPDQAIASLRRSIDLEPNLPVAHANLALAYAKAKSFVKAEESYQQALKMGYRNGDNLRTLIDEEKKAQNR